MGKNRPSRDILLLMAATVDEVYLSMGLRSTEYDLILKLMGREPTMAELGMFAVMWSEHCGYKYSRNVLRAFGEYKKATDGDGLENAGVIPIGDGLGVTFKVESHNHPSAVEPYQGAATGVGGIVRDIFTMGARPIASLNSLRFGPIDKGSAPDDVVARNRYLLEHVVRGIAGYGNCVGIPTVGGEVAFHPSYSGNPLVNAMCIGIVPLDKVTTAAAAGIGNPVLYLGSSTGLDGIHGATFASEALGEGSESKRPNVQIGDPFAEKILIEATLEALDTGAIVAIQDMGAAGITCSTVEMASKGRAGMKVNLDLVPTRSENMSAYELLLSESQERMMCTVTKGREQEVIDIFNKWGSHAVVIGEVTEGSSLVMTRFGKVEVSIDPTWLTDHCPAYTTTPQEDPRAIEARSWSATQLPSVDLHQTLLDLLASPHLTSRSWIFRQFDYQVQTQTKVKPGDGDAAVLAPRGAAHALAACIDGNARHTAQDPRRGGINAVAEAARNVACTGALPVAATDGLNFGSPEEPIVFWQFSEAVHGIAEACDALNTPVVSGNVSFYNRTDDGAIIPTPVIGMVGVLKDADRALAVAPRDPQGLMLGWIDARPEADGSPLGASIFASHLAGHDVGRPLQADLKKEAALHLCINRLAGPKLIKSAHDVSEGGLATALAEIAAASDSGMILRLPETESAWSASELLFGEWPGLVLVSFLPEHQARVEQAATSIGLKFSSLGRFVGTDLAVSLGSESFKWPVEQLKGCLTRSFNRQIAEN